MTRAQTFTQPFRLLSLPPEILRTILVKYFEDATLFAVSKDQEEVGAKIGVTGMPSLSLETTCRRLRNESFAARTYCVTRKLVADAGIFLEDVLPLLLQSDKFNWVREHVTSIHVRNSILMAGRQIEWDSFVKAFSSLTKIELHAIVCIKWSFEEGARPQLPLDSHAIKRRLALGVARVEWSNRNLFAAERMQLYQLEQAIHGVKSNNHGNLETSTTEITVQFKISASASAHFGGEMIHICDTTAIYRSEGWTGQKSVEDFKLLTVSTMYEIDGIVESYEMD